MPGRNRVFVKAFLPLGLLLVAAFALARRRDEREYEQDVPMTEQAPPPEPAAPRGRAGRAALVAAFTTLFFAGASFTAGAGDQTARLLEDNDAAALTGLGEIAGADSTDPQSAGAQAQPAEAVPADPAPAASTPEAAAPETATPDAETATPESAAPANGTAAAAGALQPDGAPAEQRLSNLVVPAPAEPDTDSELSTQASVAPTKPGPVAKPAAETVSRRSTKRWIVKRALIVPARPPELDRELGEPTIWLNRALPDPTPESARLARSFARELAAASKRHGADWAAVLGVLRAQGERGPMPATEADLDILASRLAGESAFRGALAVSGRTAFADRAAALADLYRSVGIEALVTGFQAAKRRLAERLLADQRVWIYGSGRGDIAAGRIDVRVIVLLGYLTERHGSLTVSSLSSGHRKFARPGVVSAHVFGQAVDIAAVGGSSVAGNQQPGGLTEAAVRSVLLLPAELQPQQVISLLGLGGPSFPLRDHGDHIHVGF